jgi:basic membrane protein A
MRAAFQKVIATGALVAAVGVLAGCGTKRAAGEDQAGGAAPSYTACMVTDTGGIDDNGFNGAAWTGMQAAQTAGAATVSYVQSRTETDYATNIASLQSQGCKTIVTVGGLMADATTAAAKADPATRFVEVDAPGNGTNIRGIQYNTAEASFLAGYLAAGYSKTGKVATWGGLKIAPVTVFMDGFAEGIAYYNAKKGTSVQLLGWDEAAQNGSFSGSFDDQSKGQQFATNFIAQGADVLFPVAGDAGLGTASVAMTSGKAVVIWVNNDGYVSEPTYKSVMLTTVFKQIADPVQRLVTNAASGGSDTSDYLGTLANGGVGLSPFHDFDAQVPDALKAELQQIGNDIKSGAIAIRSTAQPKTP